MYDAIAQAVRYTMKECSYCGRENEDNATNCSGCGLEDRFSKLSDNTSGSTTFEAFLNISPGQ
jgi:uncharacterized membrane protein YvbJ